MKRIFLILLVMLTLTNRLQACGWSPEPNVDYYNLFMQGLVYNEEYKPLLLTLDRAFYDSGKDTGKTRNENIEQWQKYLSLSYDDTHYLVFKSTEDDIRLLISGKKASDEKLSFVTPNFVSRHKQALLYLAYAKYLEPYMCISEIDWGYYSETGNSADQLDYEKVTTVLKRSWKAETDNELKLRYGYQLVRFAHYNRKYDEAVKFFDQYVESLNYKPAMYYHALAQKGGSERGLGNIFESNNDFFKVFVYSNDLKEMAITSMKFNADLDAHQFLEFAKTEKERNDAYLLLGYLSFSNPLSPLAKIVETSPDAIQAKVLMARAVNLLERSAMPAYYYYYSDDDRTRMKDIKDKRYPIFFDQKMSDFFKSSLSLATEMAESPKVKDKNYWYITAAYLHFLNRDYVMAEKFLQKVEDVNSLYSQQKKNLAMYIDISKHPQITSDIEKQLYAKYKDVLNGDFRSEGLETIEEQALYSTYLFVIDVLANRYFLQKDYAKSFLLNNSIRSLENNPQLDLLNYIDDFYRKPNKNEMEVFIAGRILPESSGELEIDDYIHNLQGVIYLSNNELDKASDSFSKVKSWGSGNISNTIFGYNITECFECDVMKSDYLSEFPFIKDNMNEKELTESLIQLRKIGSGNDKRAAKANYLIGNFYYNASNIGYFRHLLRFDSNNSFSTKFGIFPKPDIYDNIYFKNYDTYYENTISISQQYLQKAYYQSVDEELKARVVFALSKGEQGEFYDKNNISYYYWSADNDGILITDRKYFKELMKYKNTDFYKDVNSYCKYFNYYINNKLYEK